MNQGIEVTGLYVRDQDEALAFYVGQLGFRVHTDVRNGPYRWLTVQHPEQPSFQLGLFAPGPPTLDAASAQALRELARVARVSVAVSVPFSGWRSWVSPSLICCMRMSASIASLYIARASLG